MVRIFFLVLAFGLPASAFAQSSTACLAGARLQRDICARQTAGDNIADRRCMDRYMRELNRCRQIGLRQSFKPPPPPRINPPPIRK